MIRRINLYAGPCAGKSITASSIFTEFKKRGMKIELVSEWIKTWAYQKYQLKSFDQFYCFAKQLRKEDTLLSNGVDIIVTDSPLILNVCYTKKHKFPYWKQCLKVALEFEQKFPSINIFLDRGSLRYNQEGRYENLQEAQQMDKYIKKLLQKRTGYITIHEYQTIEIKEIIKLLESIRKY